MLREQQRLAQDQQVGLDSTETNLVGTNDSLDTGVEELTQARNLRRGCCGMLSFIWQWTRLHFACSN